MGLLKRTEFLTGKDYFINPEDKIYIYCVGSLTELDEFISRHAFSSEEKLHLKIAVDALKDGDSEDLQSIKGELYETKYISSPTLSDMWVYRKAYIKDSNNVE